jgi:LacI family transcriptional regulator
MDKKVHASDLVAERLLAQAQLPVSVMCFNDYTAWGVYHAAEKRGLVIGRDVTVIGFDDIPLAKLLKPSMTTIRQPRNQVGYEAAKLLHQMILGKISKPVHLHLPVEFILRDSA